MSQPFKTCPACGAPSPLDSQFCARCGHAYRTQFPPPGEQTQMFQGPSGAYPPYPPSPAYPPVPYTGKEKIPAGLLAILLGPLGIHLFYLGQTGWGIAYLLFGIFTCGYGVLLTSLFSLIQGILYLCASDYDFQQKYVIEKRFF